MDKSTLSNYGWVVIAVLVLSVMIALATPFGTYISNAVKSTTEGLFDVQQKAMGVAGLVVNDQGFEGSVGGSAPSKDPALNPDDGTTPVNGDTYEYGDYVYTFEASDLLQMGFTSVEDLKLNMDSLYGMTWDEFIEMNGIPEEDVISMLTLDGWSVALNLNLTDKKQTSYGTILESINGKPVIYMSSTFKDCTSLTKAPEIPSSVTSMYETFYGCTSLTKAPEIPSSVTSLNRTFCECTSLTTAPEIPSSVTDMLQTFLKCTSLTKAPEIPSSVTYMNYTFHQTSIIETVSIPCHISKDNIGIVAATVKQYHYEGCGH